MNRSRRLGIRLMFASVFVAFLFGSVLSLDAQTRKRRPTGAKKPVATTTPPNSEPLIISRADDFPDGGTTVTAVRPAVTSTPMTPVGDENAKIIAELESRIKNLETNHKADPDAKQKRLLLNLDILTRAEQRAEGLRKQMFDLIDKESTVKTRIGQIENDMRPEVIERQTAFAGSLRPEEIRAARKKSLEAEKANLESLLSEVQRTKSNVDQSVIKADALVEKLRSRLEKEIDTALDDGTKP
jgi:hypothetical protein